MTDIKTVLKYEQIIDAAWSQRMEDHRAEIPDRVINFARAIEAAVLAASAQRKEPFAYLRLVDAQTNNECLVIGNRSDADSFPVYTAPVDAQDAVDAKRRTAEFEKWWIRPGRPADAVITLRREDRPAWETVWNVAWNAALQASQSPRDQVKL